MGIPLLALALLVASPWAALRPGLSLRTFQGPASSLGDGKIQVVRVDPLRFALQLMNAAAHGGQARSAREWARLAGGVAAINPSLFAPAGGSVGLMRTPGHVSNGHLTKDKSILVFGPRKKGLPRFKLLDRECDDVPAALEQYESAAQSIRMVSCKRVNVWTQQHRRWSAAAIGVDDEGRLLLIHVRTPYTMHELVETLLKLPIGLQRLMYVEGGPEAQLSVGDRQFIGSYETGFHQADDNEAGWPIPNALVVVER